jgi:hypothetical protein
VYQQNKKNPLLLIKSLDKIFIFTLTPKLSKMKKITLTLSVIALSAVFSPVAVGQQTNQATAFATTQIIAPLSITKVQDLNFGIFTTDTSGGTVTLAASAAAVPIIVGNGIKIITNSISTAAQFLVIGTNSYVLSLPPGAITLKGVTLGNTATVDNFVSSLGSGPGTLTTLSEIVYVGGTLNIGATTNPDVYSNLTDLLVTVNYN